MPKQFDHEKKSGDNSPSKLTEADKLRILLAAATIIGAGGTVHNLIQPTAEVTKVAKSITGYVAQGPEVKNKGIKIGDTVKYLPETIEIDSTKANFRSGPATNGEVSLQGIVDDKVTVQNPIEHSSVINGVPDPNGRLFESTVDGVTIYLYVDALAAVGGIKDAETGELISIDSSKLVEAEITSIHDDGFIAEDPASKKSVTLGATYTREN